MAKKTSAKSSEAGEIVVRGEGKYPKVPLKSITIVERPADDDADSKRRLFFNPRSISAFEPEKMDKLLLSIRLDGLNQPPVVNCHVEGSVPPKATEFKAYLVELIAGERRIRTLNRIVDEDLPCFDEHAIKPKVYAPGQVVVCRGRFGVVSTQEEQTVTVSFDAQGGHRKEVCEVPYANVSPTVSGRKLYEYVECKVNINASDEKCLRLAFTENEQSEPLSITDEIALVERLQGRGINQELIAELIGANVTWVSQTATFRQQLPTQAFAKLLDNTMSRHVAVKLMSFPLERRQQLFNQMVEEERIEKELVIKKQEQLQEEQEDLQGLYKADVDQKLAEGDTKGAEKAERKAGTAQKRARKAKERKETAIDEKGVVQVGHLKKAAQKLNISPRKATMLSRQDVEKFFVEGMARFSTVPPQLDPIYDQLVPPELACIVRRTAMAILEGNRDALSVIRDYQVANGQWEDLEAAEEAAALQKS